ncbi:MAG: hypothetical protein LH472_11940 [Pyrinomonadaceae bacterium]|nr:hypothetical protein [Pyrinomonadaceae bacterium]
MAIRFNIIAIAVTVHKTFEKLVKLECSQNQHLFVGFNRRSCKGVSRAVASVKLHATYAQVFRRVRRDSVASVQRRARFSLSQSIEMYFFLLGLAIAMEQKPTIFAETV